MHYKGFLITKELPTENEISNFLKYYNEENKDNNSGFSWDWWCVGGRYAGKLKIHFDPNENEDNWFCFKDRNHKYFIVDGLDKIKENVGFYEELDWLNYMGLRDNVLYVDGAYYNDLKDFDITECCLILSEDYFNVREKWDGENFIENKEFDEQVRGIDLKDKFITIIDFHV